MIEFTQIHQEELEALESIYLQDMMILKSSPPFKFEIIIKPFLASFSSVQPGDYNLKLIVEYVSEYPVKLPKIELESITHITADHIKEIHNYLNKIMNIRQHGVPFIFELVEGTRDWVHNNLIDFVYVEEVKSEEEVIVKTQFSTYTPVTMKNFTEWSRLYQIQLNQLKTEQQIKFEQEMSEKLTGKQWFIQNKEKFAEIELEEGEEVEDYFEEEKESQLVEKDKGMEEEIQEEEQKEEVEEEEDEDEDLGMVPQ